MITHRIFSSKDRPIHQGLYALHKLKRMDAVPDIGPLSTPFLSFHHEDKTSIINAMSEHQAMLDTIRDGLVNKAQAEIPDDRQERANHLKAFGYFSDASLVGIGPVDSNLWLDQPHHNEDVTSLASMLKTRQTKTLAAGIDVIMADLKDSVEAPPRTVGHHKHVIVFLYEHYRDPRIDEPGAHWMMGAQNHRAALLSSETAVVIANYIRLLGFDAKAHSLSASDICLHRAAILAGVAVSDKGEAVAPWLGTRYGLAAITTDMDMAHDLPLAPFNQQPSSEMSGFHWRLGMNGAKSKFNRDPYAKRDYRDSAMPMESIKRTDKPTTYMDEAHIPRVPKRTDMFARAQFGDMGKAVQEGATGGYYAKKAPTSFAQRRALGAFVLLQDGPVQGAPSPQQNAQENADLIKATSHFLGVDATGISRCPEWAWYSHDARGDEIDPPHDQAISMVIDQGFETMEGASGDDWISVAQSMRAYLRFSLLGGVIAKQIRNLGFEAKAHSVMDGEVLQPPLLLLSGLGEVSRIGEVILHPFLGPRLKSGVVTTTMPLAHDKPIDFGLQRFCESCQKCARECPSGAITAGPKLMFNGYETWKSDSQKCSTYRITTKGGAMCGRCMKTCPWNLEGLFAEAPFRWAARTMPQAAPFLAKLDDMVGHGELNPVKKWWWDIELKDDGGYRPTSHPVNKRGLSKELKIKYEEQTLAVYPAPLTPHPYPYPDPMDREKAIDAYKAMISAKEYQDKLSRGETDHIHRRQAEQDAPVIAVQVVTAEPLSDKITKFEFERLDGQKLPEWKAGSHIDVLVAPEFLRAYSMSGNPQNRQKYQVAVLREDEGRGGSLLMHRIFAQGRTVFISPPINHFELVDTTGHILLAGGGIGITPMIAFAHELHAQNRSFEMHYSVSRRADLAFAKEIEAMAWQDKVTYHISEENSRADFRDLTKSMGQYDHIYCCGPDAYMEAVILAAQQNGVDEERCHREYFSVPERPDFENHDFLLHLSKSQKTIEVSSNETAADALNRHGYMIDVKCADGLCGVCQCDYSAGDVEHRDLVLSTKQRETKIILCQSRAVDKKGIITIDL